MRSILERALLWENRLDSGGPHLQTLKFSEFRPNLTPELASALDMRALKTLGILGTYHPCLTTTNEEFWSALTNKSLGAVNLTELTCSLLSPALIHFLRSFSGLEKLVISSHYYSMMSSDSVSSSHPVGRDRDAERAVLNSFFNMALQAHRASLRTFVLYLNDYRDDSSCITQEYLENIIQCTSLQVLQVPVRYPGDDLVCARTQLNTTV